MRAFRRGRPFAASARRFGLTALLDEVIWDEAMALPTASLAARTVALEAGHAVSWQASLTTHPWSRPD
jgi:hypothetical protein